MLAVNMILATEAHRELASVAHYVTQDSSSHRVVLRSYDASSGDVKDEASTDLLSDYQVLDAKREIRSSDIWILSKHGLSGRLTKFHRQGNRMIALKDARNLKTSKLRSVAKQGIVATALWLGSIFDQPTEGGWSREVTLARDNKTVVFTDSYGMAGSVAGWVHTFRDSDGAILSDNPLSLIDQVIGLAQTKNHLVLMINSWGWEALKISPHRHIQVKMTTRANNDHWRRMWGNSSSDRVCLARVGELSTAMVESNGKVTLANTSIKVPLNHEEIWSAKGSFSGDHLLLFLGGGDLINVLISPSGELKLIGRRSLGSAGSWPI